MKIDLEMVTALLRKEMLNWKRLATDRRELTPNDQGADALDYLAERLAEMTTTLEHEAETVSAEQYANEHDASAQSVRTWCRNGELAHVRDGKKYWIYRYAQRKAA